MRPNCVFQRAKELACFLFRCAWCASSVPIIPVVTIPVVRLPHERRARALRLAGAVIAAILMLPLLFRLVQDRLPGLRLPVPN